MSALPPFELSASAMEAAEHATEGSLCLQRCTACGQIQYPHGELCSRCLGDELDWQQIDGSGLVVSSAGIHASAIEWFRQRAPWTITTIRLDAGPVVIAHDPSAGLSIGERAVVTQETAENGQLRLTARGSNDGNGGSGD